MKQRWARLSLRNRLLLAVVVVVALALTLAVLATHAALKSFLVSRVDKALTSSTATISRRLEGDSRDVRPEIFRELVPKDTFVQVRSSSGAITTSTVVGSNDSANAPNLASVAGRGDGGLVRGSAFQTIRAVRPDAAPFRVEISTLNDGRQLIVGVSIDDELSTLRRLNTIGAAVGVGALAAAAAAGWLLVRIGLRPLRDVERTAAAIATGEFDRRVPGESTRTEFGRLTTTFNSMVDRIQDAFSARDRKEDELRQSEERMRRFVGDASHELRTPLAAVAAYTELFSLGADQRPQDLERIMHGIRQETSRMGALMEDLLTLARIDDGLPLAPRPIELVSIAADSVSAANVIDPSRPVRLTAPQPVDLIGDGARLRQVLDNLLANVRAHTPPQTRTDVTVDANDINARITVTDNGPGMTADHASRIFERFYRIDPSRSRRSGGAGLGLSIVDAIVQAHHGTIRVSSTSGSGTSFTITLPIASTTSGPIDA